MLNEFELYLTHVLDYLDDSIVKEAMNYSLLAGGKRLRPQLIFSVLKGYGFDPKISFRYASALEMIHTYSLIHDDLPAMDNDDLRRGRKTCHKQFNEAIAILAGDGLLTESFYITSVGEDDSKIKNQIVKILSSSSGSNGMILGQIKDIEAEHNNKLGLDDLRNIHLYKTGKLFIAALQIGATLANHNEHLKLWEEFGFKLGLAFQIQDDILDITQDAEALGKTCSDLENEKLTTVSLLGLDKANLMMNELYDECYELLGNIDFDTNPLHDLIEGMRKRLN